MRCLATYLTYVVYHVANCGLTEFRYHGIIRIEQLKVSGVRLK